MTEKQPETPSNFIRDIIDADLEAGKNHSQVVTRFPPEPNGYLHIGHAKSICLNFGIASDYKGRCHLRFDDTNPLKEDEEYTQAIIHDVKWLGFDWGRHLYYTSDYFEILYAHAEKLIGLGKAYVCDLSADEIRSYRGTLKEPGRESPYRNRSVEENLDLFRRMRKGEFKEGSRVLRARIDMASPNMVMRDPTLYRIRKQHHHRTAGDWCIYPMYDFAHCLSDAQEGITHSLCTLEFENNRPLYDWLLDQLSTPAHPQQIEFARLNLSYTLMSKRRLLELVEKELVTGWDDPRMPTIAGLRRRGFTPESIRAFADRIGVAKRDSLVDVGLLENAVRDDLNQKVPRAMAVLRPLKIVIENFPDDTVEQLEAPNFPDDPPRMGARNIPFCKELYIERDDFMEDPPKKFFRLAPGKEVRLRWAYIIKCERVIKDPDSGEIRELVCTYDPETRSGHAAGRKVKGTLHWVSAQHARKAEVRLYDRLFLNENPAGEKKDLDQLLNPASLEVLRNAYLEPILAEPKPWSRYQFERQGYFMPDPVDSTLETPVYNRIVSLRDTWAKIAKKPS